MENDKLKIYKLSDIKDLKIHGRRSGCLLPLTLFWTGSAVELNARGSELWIEIESDYDIFEQWISIIIDSVPVARQMLIKGRHWVCIFRGMNPGLVKNVRIVKDVQAMDVDPDSFLKIYAVKFDGEFLPVKEKPYKIEFIGDSIASGEGAIGAKLENDWIPMWFSALNNYCTMTAEALNADYRIISQSGWGVLAGWDNNPHSNIPEYYEKVCGVVRGEKNKAFGAFDDNDFASWQPDVVAVNLGTNDAMAFNSPEWKDEKTGETYKLRLNEDLKLFEDAVEKFLFKIRKYNKKAYIIWTYGMIGTPLMMSIYRAADSYIRKTCDKKVSVFQLPDTTDKTIGARSHPGVLAHEKAAEELSEYIKKICFK